MNISLLRLICIVQFALCGYMAVSSFVYIFDAPGWHSYASFAAFCLAVYLVSFVLQIIYKNHPDLPLSIGQKSAFNRLFILNFFMLSVLLSYNINDVKSISGLTMQEASSAGPFFYAAVLLHLLTTIFQVYILVSMVRLRRILNRNFEKKSLDLDILAG
ncbi:MAG: hypothetical protein IT249_04665 [Chitinophagaceae bacterium]|nr:hypothetical protein [Chitinophagaceae bacterium]